MTNLRVSSITLSVFIASVGLIVWLAVHVLCLGDGAWGTARGCAEPWDYFGAGVLLYGPLVLITLLALLTGRVNRPWAVRSIAAITTLTALFFLLAVILPGYGLHVLFAEYAFIGVGVFLLRRHLPRESAA